MSEPSKPPQDGSDMEALLEALSTNMEVSQNNTFGDHPRFSQYKNYGKMAENQRSRRQEWLEKQNSARSIAFDKKRGVSNTSESSETGLPTNDCNESVIEEEDGEVEGFMEVDRRRKRQKSTSSSVDFDPKKQIPGDKQRKGAKKSYTRPDMKGRLMYSEWLIDVPTEMPDEWLVVPAPIGKRVLVLASHGFTYIYDKSGAQISRFRSPLNSKPQTALLDCIMNKSQLYVLDFLMSNDLDLEQCEFDCRRMMGSSFLQDLGLFDQTQGAQFHFHLLPTIQCTPQHMTELMSKEYDYIMDGLLFYYSKVHYTAGQTPLVGWLKPWMLPEILGVPVHEAYTKDAKPSSQDYISDFSRRHPTYGLPIARRDARRLSENQSDLPSSLSPSLIGGVEMPESP